jgi:tRNA-splicing ligase RtcB (3'-phosphate/5'-hydroxy nucleic acid ligase)
MKVYDPKTLGTKSLVKYWGDPSILDQASPNFDEKLHKQIIAMASLPNIHQHVAVMPDCHLGHGVCIGSVLPLKGAICPNAVGVDIGCGMCAWNTGVHKTELDIGGFMDKVTRNIPTGFGQRTRSDAWLYDSLIREEIEAMHLRFDQLEGDLGMPVKWFDKGLIQIGTLGGGNHFWELQVDSKGILWVMIHSGSRGLGARVADEAKETAEAMCAKWYTDLPTKELAFLPDDSPQGKAYIEKMRFAQDYALLNRKVMLFVGQMLMRDFVKKTNDRNDFVNIHHNFAALENHFGKNVWVHRKGATPARPNITGIIPGSMCSTSYIVKGKANPDSFASCSHGAGRRFSRTKAKQRVKDGLDPSQESQLGSVRLFGADSCTDELASAYKDISIVLLQQKELIDIQTELTPIAVIKGDSKEARD